MDQRPLKSISVVIPVFNEGANIVPCLWALANQATHGIDYEVIIVDDASTDMSAESIKEFVVQTAWKHLRLLKNERNRGRFAARLRGIQAAQFDEILLLDAKMRLSPTAFKILARIGPSPIQGTLTEVKDRHFVERYLNIVRRRRYNREYPKVSGESLPLNSKNFDRYAKGTGIFLAPKALLLSTVPDGMGPNSSDDTKWLARINEKQPIWIHNRFEGEYASRSDIRSALVHLFDRGPKFIDYYYRPSKAQFWILNGAFILGFLGVWGFANYPVWTGSSLAVLVLCQSLWLSRGMGEFLVSTLVFPMVATFFGAGLIKGILLKFDT